MENNMLSMLFYLIVYGATGVAGGTFACFYYYTLQKDNIFDDWGNFLSKLPSAFNKPLGLCPYCCSTWITLFLIAGLIYSFPSFVDFWDKTERIIVYIILCITALGAQYLTVSIIDKYLD